MHNRHACTAPLHAQPLPHHHVIGQPTAFNASSVSQQASWKHPLYLNYSEWIPRGILPPSLACRTNADATRAVSQPGYLNRTSFYRTYGVPLASTLSQTSNTRPVDSGRGHPTASRHAPRRTDTTSGQQGVARPSRTCPLPRVVAFDSTRRPVRSVVRSAGGGRLKGKSVESDAHHASIRYILCLCLHRHGDCVQRCHRAGMCKTDTD